MEPLDVLKSAEGGEIVTSLAAAAGIAPSAAEEALRALLPELGRALRRTGESRSGAAAVHAAMGDRRYARYVESPATLKEPAAAEDGERVLDEILDDDDRRALVRRVAAATDPDEGEIRALLPRAAALAVAVLGGRLRDPAASSAPESSPEIPWFGTRQDDRFEAPLLNALARLFEAEEEERPPEQR